MTFQDALEELSEKNIIITRVKGVGYMALKWPPDSSDQEPLAIAGTWQEVYKQISKKPMWRLPERV